MFSALRSLSNLGVEAVGLIIAVGLVITVLSFWSVLLKIVTRIEEHVPEDYHVRLLRLHEQRIENDHLDHLLATASKERKQK